MPHQFALINCQYCNENYCPVCKKKCPKCGKDGIRSNEHRKYIANWRISYSKRMNDFKKRKWLEELVSTNFKLDINDIHGIKHWRRVQTIGRYLASHTKADVEVIDLFAYLHDSKREDDSDDIYHGKRASIFAQELYDKQALTISEDQLKQLQFACEHHTNSSIKSDDVTIQTCWDADRLDLWRLGIKPDPHRLNTDFAKQDKVIELWRQVV